MKMFKNKKGKTKYYINVCKKIYGTIVYEAETPQEAEINFTKDLKEGLAQDSIKWDEENTSVDNIHIESIEE